MLGERVQQSGVILDMENGRLFDSYIRLRKESELKVGFESNEQMTDYRIFRPHDGRLPFVDSPVPTDSTLINTTDTITPVLRVLSDLLNKADDKHGRYSLVCFYCPSLFFRN